jgi:glutathione S-transferase
MSMKLFYSPTSPYVRKVMVTAIEKGLDGRIEKVPATVTPISRDNPVVARNPLGKVPCLITDDGLALFDSAVITAYLDQLKAPALSPADAKGRFTALTVEALADGFLDAGLLHRYENNLRPEPRRWEDWSKGQLAKIDGALDALETTYIGHLGGPLSIGQIAVACAIGWYDFRYPEAGWRKSRPKLAAWEKAFAARPSMQATKPAG